MHPKSAFSLDSQSFTQISFVVSLDISDNMYVVCSRGITAILGGCIAEDQKESAVLSVKPQAGISEAKHSTHSHQALH